MEKLTFEQGKDQIASLVEHFRKNIVRYKTPEIKEAHVRQSLIDPMFAALGWDVRNARQVAPQYREVVVEDTLEDEGRRKAPDYAFRVGQTPRFFVEAKKCGVHIKTDPAATFQLRRYAWSAKLPLSILTDFEEFAYFDCTKRPRQNDRVGIGRLDYITYEEYPDRWRELWEIFSRDAVWSGSFDQFSESMRGRRGTAEVDDEFLKEIEGWRDELARNIALRNPKIGVEDLNRAVQLTIDRIIFLRMAEDRRIEPYERLLHLSQRENLYKHFIAEVCRPADARYNSGFFDLQADKRFNTLSIDDKVLRPILRNLYAEYDCPYEFQVIPVEILGTVYERFLGRTITLTRGHRARIEEKPEVRKAGGVYYTPRYIVDYIVEQTVGNLIEGKSPRQLRGTGKNPRPFRVLDMACGSGSFLLGAYQKLLDYYLDWYSHNNPGRHKSAVWKNTTATGETEWRLTIAEKKKILTTHVFGVDIDAQAVEVTKLSLLLRVLEGENEQSLSNQLMLFDLDRALPNLADNIKCGNSLIGPDYFTGSLLQDPEELNRVNPFDWEREFPEAMQAGGFDCVIGNPPYVRQEGLGDYKEYFLNQFESYTGISDLYVPFIEKGVRLLKKEGQFCYIVANKWMRANYGKPLRQWMKKQCIEELIDFGDLPVFQKATTYPCILRISKNNARTSFLAVNVKTLDFPNLADYLQENQFHVKVEHLSEEAWSLVSEKEQALLKKMQKTGVPLSAYVQGKIYRGVLTGLNKAFVIDGKIRAQLVNEDKSSDEIIKPFLAGRDIKRYITPKTNKFFIFTKRGIDIDNYPAIKKYLNQFKTELIPKPKDFKGDWKGRKPGPYKWYEIQDSIAYYLEFEKPKIIYPNICKKPEFTFEAMGIYTNQKCFIISMTDLYFLGLLNSSLFFYLFRLMLPKLRGDFYEPSYVYFKDFPIRPIDFDNPEDVKRHDRMVELVESMLALHKQLHAAASDREKKLLQQQIDTTDRHIDQLVYTLYALTPEEIKIVEGEG